MTNISAVFLLVLFFCLFTHSSNLRNIDNEQIKTIVNNKDINDILLAAGTGNNHRQLTISQKGYGYVCTEEQIQKIIDAEPIYNSNCPLRLWLPPILQSIKDTKYATIIAVGCNKGDDFISLMYDFSGNSSYNSETYQSLIANKSIQIHQSGQSFNSAACKSPPVIPTLMPTVKSIKGYCIEPMRQNIKLLHELSSSMQFDTTAVNIFHMAISSHPGSALFPGDHPMGVEIIGIGDGGTDEVVTNNLDIFIEENNIINEENNQILDFVSIDTEGHDANVILGFAKTLMNKYVRVFEFEYHKERRWKTADLKLIIDLIDLMNFDCYFQIHSLTFRFKVL